MKKILTILTVLVVSSVEIAICANDFALPFMRMNVGAKSEGFGGAFTALADDGTSVYWNPAVSVFNREKHVQGNYSHLSFDRSFNVLSYTHKFPLKNFALGVMFVNSGTSDIQGYSADNQKEGTFTASDNAFLLSGSYAVNQFFSFGGNLKFLMNKVENQSDNGFGLDLATFYRPIEEIKIGLVAHDIYTKVGNKSTIGRLPWNIKLGLAVQEVFEELTLTSDLTKVEGDSKIGYAFGGEWKFWDKTSELEIAFRSGVNTVSFDNLGFSAGVGFKKNRFGFEYAFVSNQESVFGQSHIISTSYSIGETYEYVSRRMKYEERMNKTLEEIRQQRIIEEKKLEKLKEKLEKK